MTKEFSAEAIRSLNEEPIVWLTTLRSDGSPHTTPTWFLFDGDCIWMASGKQNRKVINLLGDPRVSIAVDGSGPNPLVAQAHAVVVDPDDAPPVVIDGLANKYDGWDVREDSVDGHRVVLKMSVDRWLLGA